MKTHNQINLLSLGYLILIALLCLIIQSCTSHAANPTNNPAVHLGFIWDEYNPADPPITGTEVYLTDTSTPVYFTNMTLVADVLSPTNRSPKIPVGSGLWYAVAYHYFTPSNATTRIRSEPSPAYLISVPKPVGNIHLLSSDPITGPKSTNVTYEIDMTGSEERFFTLTLVPTKPRSIPIPPTP